MLIAVFVAREEFLKGVVIAVAAFVCIVPTVMSYIWYQQEARKDGE